jgi:hypothetical protein
MGGRPSTPVQEGLRTAIAQGRGERWFLIVITPSQYEVYFRVQPDPSADLESRDRFWPDDNLASLL